MFQQLKADTDMSANTIEQQLVGMGISACGQRRCSVAAEEEGGGSVRKAEHRKERDPCTPAKALWENLISARMATSRERQLIEGLK